MADQHPDHPLARLILDYVRTLLWPALIVWAFLSFQDDLLEILKTREVEVAGAFKIGQRVEDLARNTQAELADLERMVSELQAAPADPERVQAVSEALAASLEALERNVAREAAELRGAAAAPAPEARPQGAPAAAPTGPRAQARDQETVGFERLLERDLEGARAAFDEAARLWPTYHNVSEIARLLRRSGPDLAARGADGWAKLYRTILTRYSWGMPAEVREAMQHAAGAQY